HANPVNGADPSGQFEGLTGLLANMSIRAGQLGQRLARYGRVGEKIDKLARELLRDYMFFNLGYNLYYTKADWTLAATILRAASFNRKSARYAKKRPFSATGIFDCFRLLGLVLSTLGNWAPGPQPNTFSGVQNTLGSLTAMSGATVTIKGNGMPDFT